MKKIQNMDWSHGKDVTVLSEVGISGVVEEKTGNVITKFELKSVSIILNKNDKNRPKTIVPITKNKNGSK